MLIKAFEINKEISKNNCLQHIINFFVKNNITTKKYFQAMIEREKQAGFYIGNFVAIPHGALDFKKEIKNSGIVIFRFQKPIDWDNEKVYYVIGIAAAGNEQINILQNIAISFSTPEAVIKSLKIPLNNLIKELNWQ